MEHVTIRGTAVPKLGLGTWQLEGAACVEAVRHALELGYRHIDTARGYGNEREVGRGVAEAAVPRDEVFLTTKLGRRDLSGDRVGPAAEDSLRGVGTDYLDLLLIHWPSEEVPIAETMAAMLALRDQGLVREVGVSNFTPSQVDEAARHAPVFANQVEYHPLLAQDRLLLAAERNDLVLTAYSPLAKGRVATDPTLVRIAEAHGVSPSQVALRWLVQQERVVAIPRSASAEHRATNLDVFSFALSEAEMKEIGGLAREREERLVDPPFSPDWER